MVCEVFQGTLLRELLFHILTESIYTELCTFCFLPVVFICPLACLFTTDVTTDGCDYRGCIFSSLKHLSVIVLCLLNHFVRDSELRAPRFYLLSMPCNFWREAHKHPKLDKKKGSVLSRNNLALHSLSNRKSSVHLFWTRGTGYF